ncbi:MAG: DUF1499 domain-containing protein [Thermoactinomyces sp.]
MSAIQRFFSGVTETGDRNESNLKTRYYRNQKREAIEALKGLPKQFSSFRLIHVDESRGEIMLECRNNLGFKHDLVVTVIDITPIQLAVDIHAALRAKFVDFGWNGKIIKTIYDYLDRHLTKELRNG